jgi:hypothetical protein
VCTSAGLTVMALYSGMQKESSTLNLCLMTQHSTQTPAATPCDDCYRLFTGRDVGDVSRGLILQHDNVIPKKRTSDTEFVAVISLGTSAPFTQYSWPFPVELWFVCVAEAKYGRSPIPQLWGSGNICSWMVSKARVTFIPDRIFKLVPRNMNLQGAVK